MNSFTKQEISQIFSNNNGQSGAVKRLKFICSIYSEWILAQKQKANSNGNNFYDFLTNSLGNDYNLSNILQDFKTITEHTFANNMIKYEENESNNLCDLENCYILQRNYRDRSEESTNNNTAKALYFIPEKGDKSDTDTIATNITSQELMDSIHCFMDHTLRLSPKEIEKERNKISQNEFAQDSNVDIHVTAIQGIVSRKQTLNPRLRNINRFQNGQNKFMTSTTKTSNEQKQSENISKKALAAYQSLVYENKQLLMKEQKKNQNIWATKDDEPCLLDEVFREVCENFTDEKADNQMIDELKQFISEEQFDTEALFYDMSNSEQSNVYHKLFSVNNTHKSSKNSVKSVYQTCQSLLNECKNTKMDIYSNGFRFWYWPFYKNNKNQSNILFKGGGGYTSETNPGYLLCDWYIECIYGNLKDECLNNTTAAFSVEQWNMTLKMAIIKLQFWQSDGNARKLLSQHRDRIAWAEKCYGIQQSAPILIDHIMAILLYCNFTKQSYEFSRTYRKIRALESDRSLKKRHSQFGIWGKRLREIIECYGVAMSRTPDIKVYYHGVSSAMIFKSTTIKLNGPVSTTLDFMIAANTFAADGIVLNILGGNGARYSWNCTWWSTYSHEQERLFIGGLMPFFVTTIRNIPDKKNFQAFIKPMAMLNEMIQANATDIRAASKRDLKCLKLLINDEINNKYVLSLPSRIDPYVLRLFHHFAINVESVFIDVRHFTYEQYQTMQSFGYKRYDGLFNVTDENSNKTLNIQLFLSIFCNLKEFVAFQCFYRRYEGKWEYGPSMELNALFDSELIKTIKFVNSHQTLSKSLKRIVILDPISKELSNLQMIIDKYNKMVSEYGWEAKQVSCKKTSHPEACDKSLSIQRNF